MTDAPNFPLRVQQEDAFDALVGFVVDDSSEVGRCSGHLEVTPQVCQPMGIVHGGVYAAIAESLASMGTAEAFSPTARFRSGMSNNTSFLRPVSEGSVHGTAEAIHRGRTIVGVGRRHARRPRPAVCHVARHDRGARSRAQMSVITSNKVKVGFFSFTEITDPGEHRSYNEWHQLDHMPEQYPLPGIVYGQRWVSTPACRAARAVSGPELDPIHYLTLYLMTEPVDETLRDFQLLGRELHATGRWHHHRRAHWSGPLARQDTAVAPRVAISAAAVPYRPNRGVYVTVTTPATEPIDCGALCEHAGVAGAWSFVGDDRRVTVAWLDDDPVAVAARCGPVVEQRCAVRGAVRNDHSLAVGLVRRLNESRAGSVGEHVRADGLGLDQHGAGGRAGLRRVYQESRRWSRQVSRSRVVEYDREVARHRDDGGNVPQHPHADEGR